MDRKSSIKIQFDEKTDHKPDGSVGSNPTYGSEAHGFDLSREENLFL